jgi:hypothetical protein
MPGEFIARQGLISRGNVVVTGSLTTSGSLTTTGTITATTLVVQTITSSISSVTGSTNFGSLVSNTHTFTGSLNVTGGLAITTTGIEFQVNPTGVNLGNALTDSHIISGSLRVNPNGLFVSGSGFVGINTSSSYSRLDVRGGAVSQTTTDFAVGSAGTVIYMRTGATTGNTTFGLIQVGNTGDNVGGNLVLNQFGGNVGIGTSSPSKKLDIFDNNAGGSDDIVRAYQDLTTNHAFYRSQRNGGANMLIGATRNNVDGNLSANVSIVWNVSNNDIAFGTNNGERMRITAGGVLAIGSNGTPASAKVYVEQDISSGNGILIRTPTDSGSWGYLRFMNSGFLNIGGVFQTSSTTLQYATSSDYRLKEDLKDFNGLDKVSKIKVYDFKWKESEDRMEGVLAHELQEVIPYAVNGEKDGLDEDGKPLYQGVDYSKIVPALVKGMQEQNALITDLRTEIEELKARI